MYDKKCVWLVVLKAITDKHKRDKESKGQVRLENNTHDEILPYNSNTRGVQREMGKKL